MDNEAKIARAISYTLQMFEKTRKHHADHFRTWSENAVLKQVEDYRIALKEILDPNLVDEIFEKEGFPLDTEYRRNMIEEIASWKDENWFTREDLRKMPTEWLERILGLKEDD